LSPNAVQTCGDTSLGLILFNLLDALNNQALAVHLDSLNKPLQDELLVLTLEEREVCLDAVEVGTVWDIENRSRF
jgi:predicted lipid carrier protein YhbT